MSTITPQQIDAPDSHSVHVVWRDGHESHYDNVFLRFSCPCASCVNEWTGERTVKMAEIPREIRPTSWHLVGKYALSIGFSDGHDTGIYSFDLLRKLCPCPTCSKHSH